MVLRALRSAAVEGTAWLGPFNQDFRLRFMALLPGAFRCAPRTALSAAGMAAASLVALATKCT